MTTTAHKANVHDLAFEMFGHLTKMDGTPETRQHIFRVICAVERAAVGVLDDAGYEQALKDVQAAALFCKSQ